MSLKIKWIETINEFPIFKDISDTVLYSNNYEITLPLAFVRRYFRYLLFLIRDHANALSFSACVQLLNKIYWVLI